MTVRNSTISKSAGRREKFDRASAQKAVKWSILARRAEILAVVSLLCIGLIVVYRDFKSFIMDSYRVQEIQIKGTRSFLRDEDILREAGIQVGQSILTVESKSAAERIAKMSRIKEVKVYRSLPGQVHIDLIERHTAAVVKTGGKYFEIDDTGVVLGTARETLRDDFPLVSPVGWKEPTAVPGKPLEDPAIAEFLRFWSIYSEDSVAQTCPISKIVIDTFGNVETYSPVAKVKVIWGHGEYEGKLKRFSNFWRDVQAEKAKPTEYIDLKQNQVLYK